MRVERHLNGRGSRLVAAVVNAGIKVVVVARTWSGTRSDERKMRGQRNNTRWCPICKEEKHGLAPDENCT